MLEIPNIEEFKKIYSSKMPRKDIAEKYLISVSTLDRWIKSLNISRKKAVPQPIDKEELYKLRVVSKWSYRELAELYKVSDTLLIKYCSNFPKVKVKRRENRRCLNVNSKFKKLY